METAKWTLTNCTVDHDVQYFTYLLTYIVLTTMSSWLTGVLK